MNFDNTEFMNQKMLKPLMPEDMRNELIAALKTQNVQHHNRSRSVRNFKKFPYSQSPIPTSPLVAPNGSNDEDKRFQLRLQAIQEIKSSELSYLRQLEMLINHFVLPLKSNGLIQEKEHSQIFGQLETIHNLSQELLKHLDDNLDSVVKAFMNLGPFFKLYSVYAFDYRKSLCALQTLMLKSPGIKKFITNTESRPEVQTKLISLLIIPIQRIPRYKLLLQQVLLYTSPSDGAHKQLQESIRLVEQSVSHINSVVEDYENTQRLITIQNALTTKSLKIVNPGRKVLKEGVLRKVKPDGTTSKKYGILMSDMFIYCRMLKDVDHLMSENGLECCCMFPLKKCKVVEMFRGNFKLSCSGDGIIFTAESPEDNQSWLQAIREAIELHVQCRKTLRKLSSNRKPLRKKHIQRLEPEDDYLWLLRRKTASPPQSPAKRYQRSWSLRKLDCLKAMNSSYQEDTMSSVKVNYLGNTPNKKLLNQRATSAAAALDENRSMIQLQTYGESPKPGPSADGTRRKHVHFQLPASYYKR
ncbi:putative protein tag-52 [Uranotaenia lowii]|uniref:putative protein tag-52 n=1 Tax=Uranotaenia lowii TaxID=190385 RepID=UPI0024789B9D|nr:putative protein tag-52 [Uranotaenia lowii]